MDDFISCEVFVRLPQASQLAIQLNVCSNDEGLQVFSINSALASGFDRGFPPSLFFS
jgi:hypothetical protein